MGKQQKKYTYSLVVYLVNLVAIVLAYVFPAGPWLFALLFPFIFVSFGFFVLQLRHSVLYTWGPKPMPPSRQKQRDTGYSAERVLGNIPRGIKALVVVSVLYVIINFASGAILLMGGMPEVINGVPVQHNHSVVTQVTWEEYNRLKRAESRMFAGHLLVFAALPFGYFSGTRKIELANHQAETLE